MRNGRGINGQRGGVPEVTVRTTIWNGRPTVIVRSGGGSRGRRVVTCASIAERDEVARTIIEQVDAGALLETETGPAPQRVGELLEQFMQAANDDERKRAQTKRNYQGRCNTLTAHLGEVPLRCLVRSTIVAYVQKQRARGRKASGIESDIRILRVALQWGAETWGWTLRARRICEGLDYGTKARRRALSVAEVERLRKVITNPTFRVAFELGAQAGLRAREIITRTWSDWDRDRRTLDVGAKPGFVPKNGEDGIVPLTPDLNRILAAEYLRQGRPGDDAPIVPTIYGKPRRSTYGLGLTMDEACEASDVKRITVHELRHTCGSLLIEAGAPLVLVSRILRHKSVRVTEQVYVHVNNAQIVGAADQLQALFDQRPANGAANANAS